MATTANRPCQPDDLRQIVGMGRMAQRLLQGEYAMPRGGRELQTEEESTMSRRNEIEVQHDDAMQSRRPSLRTNVRAGDDPSSTPTSHPLSDCTRNPDLTLTFPF